MKTEDRLWRFSAENIKGIHAKELIIRYFFKLLSFKKITHENAELNVCKRDYKYESGE